LKYYFDTREQFWLPARNFRISRKAGYCFGKPGIPASLAADMRDPAQGNREWLAGGIGHFLGKKS
jgi:hypothetical protein